MQKNERLQQSKYIFWDLIASMLSYSLLFYYRRVYIMEADFSLNNLPHERQYYLGLILVPIFWVTVYLITNFYRDIYRRSRLKEVVYTFNSSLLGSIFIFFALMLDDFVTNYTDYYRAFLVYFASHFFITVIFRGLLSSRTAYRIRHGKIWFNTVLIGSNEKAARLLNDLGRHARLGQRFIGFVSVHNNIRFLVKENLPHLGTHNELPDIIRKHGIEEVIIAIESTEHEKLETIVNILEGTDVKVKMIPDTYDIISGKVKLQSLASSPLIEINHELAPLWQKVVKRFFDFFISLTLLMLLSPLFLFSAIMVKLSSPGPVFFRQRRVGLHGHEFKMIKFRSMYQDAERHGPMLSSENDSRITRWGRIMRKYRLDELPQFLNVLTGEMSIVGPRPERLYYIEQISHQAPHVRYLQKVKPGITSWGMVKFGYAENVNEMVERLKYDVIYIENMNLFNDLKILIYTVLIVLQGRGK